MADESEYWPALAQADAVRVIRGAGFDPRNRRNNDQLAIETDLDAVTELVGLVLDWAPGEPFDWMEWPAVSVVFIRGREVVAEFGLLTLAEWVRTPEDGDRELSHPVDVRGWLSRRGVFLD